MDVKNVVIHVMDDGRRWSTLISQILKRYNYHHRRCSSNFEVIFKQPYKDQRWGLKKTWRANTIKKWIYSKHELCGVKELSNEELNNFLPEIEEYIEKVRTSYIIEKFESLDNFEKFTDEYYQKHRF